MIRPVLLLVLTILTASSALAQNSSIQQGEEIFQGECSRCHIPIEMEGRLRSNWTGRTADQLYEQIKATMPAEAPGSLSDEEYIDVTAYILSAGNSPVPDSDLSEGDLASLTIDPVAQEPASSEGEQAWASFNGGVKSNRYSPLDQINADNVDQLEVAWRWSSVNYGRSTETFSVASPLMVDGKLFTTAGNTRNVVSVDPATGQTLWMWRPQEGERFDKAPRKGSGKGLAYWNNGSQDVIFTVTPGYHLVGLNAETGLPVESFGTDGWVDLQQGLRLAPNRDDIDIGLSFPPLVVDDVVIVGAAHLVSMRPPSAANVKGDVRGFDAHTGELLWTFHTIPEKGEPGYETWLDGSAEYTGNAGVWAPMSADPELGLVYLPVESATGDRYGGDRPGSNLFANSLVALDYKTGEMAWHYQIIHHDIWDWDNPSAPILADLPDGRKVVAQLTKQSFAYVFDRKTGEPIWDIEETEVPQTDVPGEWTSPTQPFPTKPAPYDRQGVSEDDLIDFTAELRQKALEAIEPYRMGPLFTPPSVVDGPDGTQGTLSLPNTTGGSNWEGGAYDPETGMLYVQSRTAAALLGLVPGGDASTVRYIQGGGRVPEVDGLPLIKPPYGRITAIDLTDGEHEWQVANADTPDEIANHPALEGVDLPRTGIPTRVGLFVTETLLFAGEGTGGNPIFRAYDKATGEIVAEIDIPASQTGMPITYMHEGRQYIVMTVSNFRDPAEMVALALPE